MKRKPETPCFLSKNKAGFLLKMKLLSLFLFAAVVSASATSYSQKAKFSLEMNKVKVKDVFQYIEDNSEFIFLYNEKSLNVNRRVSISANDVTVESVLDQVFSGTLNAYNIYDRQIVIYVKEVPIETTLADAGENAEEVEAEQPRQRTITGNVTYASGEGIPGVNVVVKGTTIGTITNVEGNFQLNVPIDAQTLVFSFVGLVSQEVPINDRVIFNVIMEEDVLGLEEVVVVGYGIQRKESVVGSIVVTSGEELVQSGGVATVSEALTGLLPGVTSMQATGMPGASYTDILIRGRATWNDSAPLILVDGVERDFNNIDINEVESLSVLKDASATAVFGVKAANGVILVTTKQGLKGKPKVSFNTSYGVKTPVIQTDFLADFPTTLRYYNVAAMNDRRYGDLKPQSYIDAWEDPNRDPRLYTYTDWVDYLFDNVGYSRTANINISGGTDFVKYFTSFGYFYDGDVLNINPQPYPDYPQFDPSVHLNRYNYRANLDFNLTKTTRFGINLSGQLKHLNTNEPVGKTGVMDGSREVTYGSGQTFIRAFVMPMIGPPPFFETGEMSTERGVASNFPNRMYYMERHTNVQTRDNLVSTDFILNQDLGFLLEGLRVGAKLSYDMLYEFEYTLNSGEKVFSYDPDRDILELEGDPDALPRTPVGLEHDWVNDFRRNLYYEASANYNKTFNKHEVGVLGLFLRRKNTRQVDFPSYEESWVGRFTYNFDNRYFAEVNGAYNGSEKFAPGLRFGFFPSVAVGWVVTNENFMQDRLSFLSNLKFRYSYGEVGSDFGAPRFTYISLYNRGPGNSQLMPNFGTPHAAYSRILEGAPANENATWERAIKQNLGIELGFLDNRLYLNIDLFDEKRSNILMSRQSIPYWYGNSNPVANIGETKNHGIDFEFSWRQRVSNNFSYWTKGNISLSENRMVFRDDLLFTPEYQRNAGKPIGWLSAFSEAGLFNTWDDVFNYTRTTYTPTLIQPGDRRYIDYNADGVIDQYDRVPLFDPSYPAKSGAFSLGAGYKGFSVTAMFSGVFDVSKTLPGNYAYGSGQSSLGVIVYNNHPMLNYWRPDNFNASFPTPHLQATHNNQLSTYTIRSANYLRFKTMEFKYRFSKDMLNKMKLFESAEIYLNGNNLFTWHSLPGGMDPEARTLEVYPLVRRYNLGIRVSF